MNIPLTYAWIAFGSALGGMARFGCSMVATQWLGPAFPWGTITINVVGSFVIGLFATLSGPDGRLLVRTTTRQFVMVGLCGGYTTFSAFSLETLQLLHRSAPAALANVGLSLAIGLAAVWGGHQLATRFNQ